MSGFFHLPRGHLYHCVQLQIISHQGRTVFHRVNVRYNLLIHLTLDDHLSNPPFKATFREHPRTHRLVTYMHPCLLSITQRCNCGVAVHILQHCHVLGKSVGGASTGNPH